MSSPLPNPPTLDALLGRRRSLRAAGKRLVLTNGCFDLLHAGHIWFLNEAAKLGDFLVVGLNGDASVRALKGPNRPIQNERERAYALQSLRAVGAIFLFQTPRLGTEITALQPDIYTKAGDYTAESLDRTEKAALDQCGATISFIPFLPGHSTTTLVETIRKVADSFATG